MTSTIRGKAGDIRKEWHVIDAEGRSLGRVASEVASLILGKHKPTFEPHLDDGDFVIVINASSVRMTGRKAEQNRYYRHSGYPGNLRERTWAEQMERRPEFVIENAVYGMLPKGSLGHRLRRHLKVYAGSDHPHQSQLTSKQEEVLSEPKKPKRLAPLAPMIAPVDPPRLTRAQKIAAALEDNALESSPTTERYVTFNDDAEAVESVKTEDVSDSDSGDSLVVLGLAQRSVNALEAAGFSSVEQIVGISDDELLAVKGFGPKALEQLDDALQEHGFSRLAEGSEEDNG
tara:strand:- start:669 stop:1532 length:864 start_codon:yes stop_codon:yes gene_type:complete